MPGPEGISKSVPCLFPSSLPVNAFLYADRGLDHKPSWALGCCGQGVFWIWHVPGNWAAGAGVAGWGGSVHNESLCLSSNAGEPEAGVGGNREDAEDVG